MAEFNNDYFQSGETILRKNAEAEKAFYDVRIQNYKAFESSKSAIASKGEEERLQKALNSLSEQEQKELENLEHRQRIALNIEKEIAEARARGDEEAAQRAEAAYTNATAELLQSQQVASKMQMQLAEETAKFEAEQRIKAQELAKKHELQKFRHMSNTKKVAYVQETKAKIASDKEVLKQEIENLEILGNNRTKDQEDEFQKKILQLQELNKFEETNNNRAKSLKRFEIGQDILRNITDPGANRKQHLDKAEAAIDNSKGAKNASKELAEYEAVEKAKKELRKAQRSGTAKEKQSAKEKLAAAQADLEKSDEYKKLQEEAHQSKKEALKEAAKSDAAAVVEGAKKVLDAVNSQIEGNVKAMYGEQGRMMGRLQGSVEDWAENVDQIDRVVGLSGYVSKKSVIAKMVELVDAGVAYNLEMRAFLAETSENIASTFDATNGTLLRLIRIQQQDTTAARLGMEATLTKLFNSWFSDTSYLANDVSQSVSDAIIDAAATMTRDGALEFEYVLQKWLGSLYSIGLSSDAVNTIATGINYLGTGNVTALSGNSELTTLLAMSASRSGGKSYAQLLLDGLDATETNKLLKAMVEYLAEIAEQEESNKVTKAAYADVFGLNFTDLSIFRNLKEIDQIYAETTNYSALENETRSQLLSIKDRLHLSNIVDTAVENAMVGASQTIGSNAGLYGTWKATAILRDMVGAVKLPAILAMGTGIAEMDLLNVAQTVIAGIGLISSLIGGLSSAGEGGALALNRWDFKPFTPRGEGLSFIQSGTQSSTSMSAMLGSVNASAEDIETTTLETAEQKGTDELNKIQSEELSEEMEWNNKIYEAIADEDGNTVLKCLMSMCGATEEEEDSPEEETPEQKLNQSGDESNSSSPNSPTTNNNTSNNNTSNNGNSSNIDNSVSTGPSTSTEIQELQSSTEMYSKIYEAIAEGESVNVLTVLQEINDRLSEDRVFYTSMVSASGSSNTVNQIVDTSAQLRPTPDYDDGESEGYVGSEHHHHHHKHNEGSSGLGKLFTEEESSEALELIIATAVETALRSVAGYSSGSGLPVVVTNLNNYGG